MKSKDSITYRLFWILSRDGWVSTDTLCSLCSDLVKPERAVRDTQARSPQTAEQGLEEAIRYGVRYNTIRALVQMEAKGLVEIARENSPTQGGHRILTKARLKADAWKKTGPETQHRLLLHLNHLIKARRCEIWIEVLPQNYERNGQCANSTNTSPITATDQTISSTNQTPDHSISTENVPAADSPAPQSPSGR